MPSFAKQRKLICKNDNNICVCVSTETSPLFTVQEPPLYIPLILHALEKDTRIHNPSRHF